MFPRATTTITKMRSPLISIIGSTGTGKSQVSSPRYHPPNFFKKKKLTAAPFGQLAVELALALNGEVINADAMQLYRGLPIITNKITDQERRGVPHHLLGFLDTRDVWQVGCFVREAEKTVGPALSCPARKGCAHACPPQD